MTAAMTTAASVAAGRSSKSPVRKSSATTVRPAASSPETWVRAPAEALTAVFDRLPLTTMPLDTPPRGQIGDRGRRQGRGGRHGSHDEHPRAAKRRVQQQRAGRRVEAHDRRHVRDARVRERLRNQDRPEREARDQIAAKPRALIIGIGVSLLLLFYRASRPYIAVLGRTPGPEAAYRDIAIHDDAEPPDGIVVVRIESGLYFASPRRREGDPIVDGRSA
jgi:hypothetical protein